MNRLEKAILLGLILSVLITITGFAGRCENIEQKVFRLHVLANSDSSEDQELKLKVRDKILQYSSSLFAEAETKNDAKQITDAYLSEIEKIAQEEVHNQGYNYGVRVELANMYFNTRRYGDVTLPAGKYDALRVLIGEGRGKNWWCVMFPPMCLPAASKTEELDDVLDDDEMDIVQNEEEYEIAFKIVELIAMLRSYLEFLISF